MGLMGRVKGRLRAGLSIFAGVSALCTGVFFVAGDTLAQGLMAGAQAGEDPGVADTVYVSGADVNAGDHFKITVSLTNDEELAGATLGFGWGSPALFLDSISYANTRLNVFPISQTPSAIDNAAFTALTGFFIIFPPGLGAGSGSFADLWFTVPPGTPDQFVDIDSMFIPPSGDFILVALAGNVTFTPQFVGGQVKIGNPSEPPTIAVDADSFYFEAIEGDVNPPPNSLTITNIGLGTLSWTATWSSSWLGVAPSSGTAPSTVQITANSNGLPAGEYLDTIVVSDPLATNNPVEIPVRLVVTPPPPTIGVSQSAFFFNAIADSTNPPSQTLTITNTGGSSLNWAATNSEAWLDVSPAFGGDATDVTLSVDITGLAFGDYSDTIVIVDTNATNNPVKVPVSLSVASDLPIIRLDPDTLVVVVDLAQAAQQNGGLIIDTAYFNILNDGAGAMTYSTFENSSFILNTFPDSGSAPETVGLVLRFGNPVPGDILDSLDISSPQAINSPQRMYVLYHFTNTPANIVPLPDTIVFTQYECEQGASFVPEVKQVFLQNLGEPVSFTLTEDVEWLSTTILGGTAQTTVTFAEVIVEKPLGTYLDSIRVDAPFSQTHPVWIYTQLNMLAGTQTPVILTNKSEFIISARENSNFQYCPIQVIQINNFFPGCFDWEIVESVPWLTAKRVSGQNPGSTTLIADGTGYTFGEYPDQFQVTSPQASNSPLDISVKMRVWRLFGDADYSNSINIVDVVYLIDYIFNNGPAPEPEVKIGDVDCTGTVNVADVTGLIEYIFGARDVICGNEGM